MIPNDLFDKRATAYLNNAKFVYWVSITNHEFDDCHSWLQSKLGIPSTSLFDYENKWCWGSTKNHGRCFFFKEADAKIATEFKLRFG